MTPAEIRLDELNILATWALNIQSQSAKQLIGEYVLERTKELAYEAGNEERTGRQEQTKGGVCRGCGGSTTYTRQNSTLGLCLKCESEKINVHRR